MNRIVFLFSLTLLISNCSSHQKENLSLDTKTKSQLDSLKNTAVFTTKNIINKKMLITRVYHNADGSWQFFDDVSTNSNENVMLVAFGQIIQRDSSLIKLLDMPFSHFAHRKAADEDWKIDAYKQTDE